MASSVHWDDLKRCCVLRSHFSYYSQASLSAELSSNLAAPSAILFLDQRTALF